MVKLVELKGLRKMSMIFDILHEILEGFEEQTGGVTFYEMETNYSVQSYCPWLMEDGLSSAI